MKIHFAKTNNFSARLCKREKERYILLSRRTITAAIWYLFTNNYENNSGYGGVICSTVFDVYRAFAQQNRRRDKKMLFK